jgi:hypothetical protein
MAALSETVGPIEGWRLRYKLQRVDMTFDPNVRGPQQVGSFVRLQEYTLIPVSGQMGEPLDEALRSTSQFRSSLAGLSPRDTTVTLWTYPDSFGEYRRLKEELHKAGYSVAGRPLPEGHPIGGSPSGSKSAAQ